MPIDRDAALREAEQLLRQGKLDGAIEAYVRLVDDRPSDWSSINTLGDLCLRAGDVERAIAQFTRVADQFFSDGSLQKAAALYKKALRAQEDHEPALQQLGEIAVRQGLKADAEVYLQRLADQRQRRGDDRGAAESLARLGTLQETQTQSRNDAAPLSGSSQPPVPSETLDQSAVEGSSEASATLQGTVPEAEAPRQADESAEVDVPLEFEVRLKAAGPHEIETSREIDLGAALDEVSSATDEMSSALVETVDALVDPTPSDQESPKESAEVDVPLEIEVPLEAAGPHDIEASREIDLGAELDEISSATDEMPSASVETADALADPTPSDLEPPEESAGVDVAGLEAAAHDAETRFTAATALGRHYIRQGDVGTGIQWLERATGATPASREEAFSVLYDLADALERRGELPRALTVLIDLDLDSGGYRDGRARIDRLMAAQTRSDET